MPAQSGRGACALGPVLAPPASCRGPTAPLSPGSAVPACRHPAPRHARPLPGPSPRTGGPFPRLLLGTGLLLVSCVSLGLEWEGGPEWAPSPKRGPGRQGAYPRACGSHAPHPPTSLMLVREERSVCGSGSLGGCRALRLQSARPGPHAPRREAAPPACHDGARVACEPASPGRAHAHRPGVPPRSPKRTSSA